MLVHSHDATTFPYSVLEAPFLPIITKNVGLDCFLEVVSGIQEVDLSTQKDEMSIKA